jgi:hypothetical protein
MTQEQKEAAAEKLYPILTRTDTAGKLALSLARTAFVKGCDQLDKEVEELRGVIAELVRVENHRLLNKGWATSQAINESNSAWAKAKQILEEK